MGAWTFYSFACTAYDSKPYIPSTMKAEMVQCFTLQVYWESVSFCFLQSVHFIENTLFAEDGKASRKIAQCHFLYYISSFHRSYGLKTSKSTGMTLLEGHNVKR